MPTTPAEAVSKSWEKPRAVTLKCCDFPVVPVETNDRTALMLPPEIRRLMDTGITIVRINSKELAERLPNYGSEASGRYSLSPHKDNFGNDADPKRYLMLSKTTPEARGASTLIWSADVALKMLPAIEAYFYVQRPYLWANGEYEYNPKFRISEAQYIHCLKDANGYDEVINALVACYQESISETTLRLNVLNYLMRGPGIEPLMAELVERFGNLCVVEPWEKEGVVIIDNTAVFHARIGGNDPPLPRNFCV